MTSKSSKFSCWLWPDHQIGKRESRSLREEHNAVVNSNVKLLEACESALRVFESWKKDENPHNDLKRGESPNYDAACDMAELMRQAIHNATESE